MLNCYLSVKCSKSPQPYYFGTLSDHCSRGSNPLEPPPRTSIFTLFQYTVVFCETLDHMGCTIRVVRTQFLHHIILSLTSYKYPLLCWLKSYGVMKSQLLTLYLAKMCKCTSNVCWVINPLFLTRLGYRRIFNTLTSDLSRGVIDVPVNCVSWKLCECTSRLRFLSD